MRASTCARGVRFSNSNRITHSDYRILLLLKMHIPSRYVSEGGKERPQSRPSTGGMGGISERICAPTVFLTNLFILTING